MLAVALAAGTIMVVSFLSPPAVSGQKSLTLDANVSGVPTAQVVVNAENIPKAGVLAHLRVSESASFSNFFVRVRRDGVFVTQLQGRRPVRSSAAAVEISNDILNIKGNYKITLFSKDSETAIGNYSFEVRTAD